MELERERRWERSLKKKLPLEKDPEIAIRCILFIDKISVGLKLLIAPPRLPDYLLNLEAKWYIFYGVLATIQMHTRRFTTHSTP